MGLIQKTGKAVAENAFGKTLESYGVKDDAGNIIKKVNYDFSWFEFEDDDSLVAAKEELTLEEQRKVVNAGRKTTARQAANAATIKALGIEAPTAETDSQIRLKQVFNGLFGKYRAAGMAEEDARVKARAKAAEMLEEDWTDSAE